VDFSDLSRILEIDRPVRRLSTLTESRYAYIGVAATLDWQDGLPRPQSLMIAANGKDTSRTLSGPIGLAELSVSLIAHAHPTQVQIVCGCGDVTRFLACCTLDIGYSLVYQSDGYYGISWHHLGHKFWLLDLRGYYGDSVQHVSYSAISALELGNNLINHYAQMWPGINPFASGTLGALASKIYRLYHLKKDRGPLQEGRATFLRALRPGGLVWAQPGDYSGSYALYDASSAYPSAVLRIHSLPYPSDWYAGNRLVANGIYRAKVRWPEYLQGRWTDGTDRPLWTGLFLRYGDSGTTYASGHELLQMASGGAEIKIEYGYTYRKYSADTTLSSAIYRVLGQRATYNTICPPLALHHKLLANAMIGKLAQHSGSPTMPLGTMHAPDWSVLIIGYVRAALMAALRQAADVRHIATDGFICRDAGPLIQSGLDFVRRAQGNRLIVLGINRWILLQHDIPVDWAIAGVPAEQQPAVVEAVLDGKKTITINVDTLATLPNLGPDEVVGQLKSSKIRINLQLPKGAPGE